MKRLNRILVINLIFLGAIANGSAQPLITKQPANQSVSPGASLKFQVSATTTNAPILFQWRFATTNVPNETNSGFTLTNIQIPNAGDYDAVLTDGSGSVTSRVAHLEVDPAFTKITEGEIVNDLGVDFGHAAWGDFNNDGFLDLFVSNYGGTNVFYRNNGNGTFTKISQEDPVHGADNHTGPSWADYDNDGNLDLLAPAGFFAATPSYTQLYHNNGDGTFSRASGGSITDQAGYFTTGSWGDYDNDGFLDLFIGSNALNASGKNLLFHNNGNGTFTKIVAGSITSDVITAGARLWADYDNDGFMDLLVVNDSPNGVNFLYHNNGHGTFTRVLTNTVVTDRWPGSGNGGGICGTWGDYDNDGFPDLFLTTGAGALNRLYHNNGDGTFTKITSGPMLSRPVGADSNGCVWGDYDNDGFLDLFVSSIHGRNQLFRNNGNGTFTEILSGSPVNNGTVNTYYFGVSWVDYDNDGSLDLFVAGGSTDQGPGKNLLYHNGGNSNAWLEVKCVGTVSNRSAIGAKVRVLATISGKTFWQLREIAGGGGYNNPPLVAHFGLGDATNVDLLRIEWPSGIAQEFPGVDARQILSVTEPPRLQATAAGQVQFRSRKGQAFVVEGSANLTAWSVLATITNLTGILQFTDPEALSEWQHFYRVRPK